jgi:hypothetical protein
MLVWEKLPDNNFVFVNKEVNENMILGRTEWWKEKDKNMFPILIS